MKAYFSNLIAYNVWANIQIADTLEALPQVPARALEVFSHIQNSESIWMGRVTGKPSTLDRLGVHSLDKCLSIMEKNAEDWTDFVLKLQEEDFGRTLSYQTFSGEPFSTPIQTILAHVVNHSSYHRGQVTAALKGVSEKLPVTDLIVFDRLKPGAALG